MNDVMIALLICHMIGLVFVIPLQIISLIDRDPIFSFKELIMILLLPGIGFLILVGLRTFKFEKKEKR